MTNAHTPTMNFDSHKVQTAYETMELNNLFVSRIETVVIDSIVGADSVVLDYIADVLSNNYPFQIVKEEKVRELWSTARNREQKIVDWILGTYYNASRAAGGEAGIDAAIKVYSHSVGFDVSGSVMDEDLGSRLSTPKDAEQLLLKNRWFVIILALFSIDLESLPNANE